MTATTRTRRHWGPLELGILQGRGIDIGCGPDPVSADAMPFDMDAGDANRIDEYVREQFDYVYSSHCLEHMHSPPEALRRWWKLVKPGGHLFLLVPDEDLYEQGFFPSIFNGDHKATFTIAKAKSWSPVSYNLLDLVNALPDGRVIQIVLQDHGYDHARQFRPSPRLARALGPAMILRRGLVRRGGPRLMRWNAYLPFLPVDQMERPDVLAQIQCIVQKVV